MGEISDGIYRRAMHEVMPLVPELGKRPYFGYGESVIDKQPQIVQKSLVDALAEAGALMHEPRTHKEQLSLAKVEVYTIVGATAAALTPIMIEGAGFDSQFKRNVLPKQPDADPSELLTGMFFKGYGHLLRKNWLDSVSGRFWDVHHRYMALGPPSMRQAETFGLHNLSLHVSGGDTAARLPELSALAAQHDPNGPIEAGMSSAEIYGRLSARARIMHPLGYLTLAQAGQNIALTRGPVSALTGQLVAKPRDDGTERQFFKSADRDSESDDHAVKSAARTAWSDAYPSPRREEHIGPTLKCPVHQPKQPMKNGEPEVTPLNNILHAVINYGEEHPHLLMTLDDIRTIGAAKARQVMRLSGCKE